jgi:hypothetical protein
MNKNTLLIIAYYLFCACTRQPTAIRKANQVNMERAPLSSSVTQSTDSTQVDDTFISIPTIDVDAKCKIYGLSLARSEGRIGYVSFNEEVGMYSIIYTFPGLITDEQWTGYVCNLPEKYKKSGLKVGFVGSYYAAYQHIKPRHAGDTPLYLVIEKIKVL